MAIEPTDILRLSKQLHSLNQDAEESWKRCIVSRAYYAALHAVERTFDQGARIAGESSHAEVIGRAVAYGNQVVPGRGYARTIAQMLPKLRRLRNRADYHLNDSIDESEYSDVIVRAEKVLSLCENVETARCSSAVQSLQVKGASSLLEAVSPQVSQPSSRPRPSLKRVK